MHEPQHAFDAFREPRLQEGAEVRQLHEPPQLLYLEITESGHMPDMETVRTNIAVLQGAGVGLSLADFGTGSSALTTPATILFTEVKIDHSMISRIDQPRMREAVSRVRERDALHTTQRWWPRAWRPKTSRRFCW